MRALLVAGLALTLACNARSPVALDARIVPRDGGMALGCAPIGSVQDGQPCVCAADCRHGALCVDEATSGVPGGLCVRVCPLSGANECSAGATCVDVVASGAPDGLCELPCRDHTDCPRERSCGEGLCTRFCVSDEVCRSGHCDPWTSRCSPDGATPTGLGTMAACTRGEQCRSGLCHAGLGRCISACSLVTGLCPPGDECVYDSSTSLDDVGLCLTRCTQDADCSPDLRCGMAAGRGPTGPGPSVPVCVPR